MKRRDQAIQQASELFADRKQELREKQMQLDAQARFLENEEVNNKELDMNISMNERAVVKLREELSVKSAKVNFETTSASLDATGAVCAEAQGASVVKALKDAGFGGAVTAIKPKSSAPAKS